VVIAIVVAGCGGLGPTPVEESPSPVPIPEASFTGGQAGARLDTPTAVRFDGGWCSRGPGDAWLALNVGFPNGEEYFGLVVGQSPFVADATRSAAGGGTFGGADVVVTWRHAGVPASLVPTGLVLEMARDLSLGTFHGALADGTAVRGTFSC